MRGFASSTCLWAITVVTTPIFVMYNFWMSTYEATPYDILKRNGNKTANKFNKTPSAEVKRTQPTFLVPNIVHFIRFKQPKISFVGMICIKSALQVIKPDTLFIHCDVPPNGKYWDMIKHHKNIQIVLHERPYHIFGRPMGVFPQHASDVARLEILMEQGGIYLDNDVYVIKPFDTFREHSFTVGWPKGHPMGNMILVSAPHAPFLLEYYDTYHTFTSTRWYFNAGELPTNQILRKKPGIANCVPNDVFGVVDGPRNGHLIFGTNSDWRDRWHAVHLQYRSKYQFAPHDGLKEYNPRNIKKLATTLGQMFRYTFYGTTDLIE